MSARSKYTPVQIAAQGVGGNCNLGIVVVRHIRTGYTYIEKRAYPDAINQGQAKDEIRVMQRCNGHPNMVYIQDYDLDYSRLGYGSIYLQHAELGSLDALIGRYIQRRATLEDEGFAWKILWNLSIALTFLQTGQKARDVRQLAISGQHVPVVPDFNPIFHRDLKPSNVFLTWTDSLGLDYPQFPNVLLGDFGCAVTGKQVLAGRGDPRQVPGNDPTFSSPEHPNFSDRSDIYSLGLLILCLANRSQSPPGNGMEVLAGASAPLRTVVGKCLMPRECDRTSPQDLPSLVWWGYQRWLAGRRDCGKALPSWALRQ